MIFSLIVAVRAQREIDKIIDWYDARSAQATENFLIELKETFDKITAAPFRYRNTRGHYREIRMEKYPYYIVYFVDEQNKQIKILTVYHTSRNSKNKYDNLANE